MRGERERACLDTIIQSVFYDKDGNLRKDLEGKSYQEVSEDQFLKKHGLYADIDNRFLFGLTQEDYIEVLNILRKAKENEAASKFPDFVFDNGFIEHFQITSSRETKKGAEQVKKEKEFERESRQQQQEFMKMCEAEPSFDIVRSCSSSMELPPHDYQYLTKSVKSNFEHHLKSLEKYTGNKEIGVFLIESSELAVNMVENIFKDWKDGISPGDLRKQQYFSCYRLSRDKKLLNYFYGFKSKLKYLFYCYQLQPWAVSTGGTIPRLYNDNILKAKIPVPPLEEQKRIVKILDRFDKLCNDLTEGLPAEIEARKKQYEYYRDQLLTFNEIRN